MRRLDLHPKRKLKNPARHLRSLKRWQETVHLNFIGDFHPNSDDRYWNIRLPVYSKLCDPPHTKPEYQRACLEALLVAAQNIRAHVQLDRKYRLAILFATPSMFQSEVTLFFDMNYLESFYPSKKFGTTEDDDYKITSEEPQVDQYTSIGLDVPAEFEFLGGYRLIEIDKDPEGPFCYDYNQWIIVERLQP